MTAGGVAEFPVFLYDVPFTVRHTVLACCILLPAAALVWQQSIVHTPKPAVRPVKPVPKIAVPVEAAKPVLSPRPLEHPPEIVKAVYFTGWSAGLNSRVEYLTGLAKTTAINSVVFDVKDYSGNISYRVGFPEAKQYGAVRVMIRDVDGLVERLHSENIYVIARITCFQDPVLAAARPDLAVHRVSKLPKDHPGTLTQETLWLDRKGLAWINPASRPAWNYIVAIAKDALAHGVDEVNFDYIRFPSDGDLKDMYFPGWDGKTPKHEVIREFFRHLRRELAGVRISADLFGLAAVNDDDLGIGQVIEDAYATFDYVCPMVYPSHFAKKFLGFANPAERPYEVVNYSIKQAGGRLDQLAPAKLRPWLQDFNLGARYDAAAVTAQIKAVEDALGARFAGYMLWSPSNVYTRQALAR